MGFLDRLFGRTDQHRPQGTPPPAPHAGGRAAYPGVQDAAPGQAPGDAEAIARYRYLLRTAPPEQIEQAHAEAFARLSPEQRRAVLAEMGRTLPPEELPRSADPQAMARTATRAEMMRPGYLTRTFGGVGVGGMGMGGVFASSMLGSIAGIVVGSAIAGSLLDGFDSSPEAAGADLAAGDIGDQADQIGRAHV